MKDPPTKGFFGKPQNDRKNVILNEVKDPPDKTKGFFGKPQNDGQKAHICEL